MAAKGQTQSCDKLELIKKSRTRPERGERLAVERERDWLEVAVDGSCSVRNSIPQPALSTLTPTNCTVKTSRADVAWTESYLRPVFTYGYVRVHKHRHWISCWWNVRPFKTGHCVKPRNSCEDDRHLRFVINKHKTNSKLNNKIIEVSGGGGLGVCMLLAFIFSNS